MSPHFPLSEYKASIRELGLGRVWLAGERSCESGSIMLVWRQFHGAPPGTNPLDGPCTLGLESVLSPGKM